MVGVGALLQVSGGFAIPARGAAEGAQVAAGWAVRHPLAAGADTFTPVEPTLASGQIAGWDLVTGAFDRTPYAVTGGRELMAVGFVAAAALVWLLARRLGLARWTSVAAVAVVAFSPLAVDLHRTVDPANLAMAWLLAALVLTCARRRHVLAAWVAAGVLLALAVLTEPLLVVAVPAAGWQLWRAARPTVRLRAVASFGGAFALVALPVWALVLERRLTPTGGGAMAELGVPAGRAAADLISLDPLGAVACAVSAVVAPLAAPRLRPLASAFWPLVALAFLDAGSAAAALICAVPLGAILLGGGAQALWTWTTAVRRTRRASPARPSVLVATIDAIAPAALVALTVVAAVAIPRWTSTHADLARDVDAPLRDAQAWMATNLGNGERLIVDDAIWVDLVESGAEPADLASYARIGGSWRDYDFVVATGEARRGRSGDMVVQAIEGSQPVAEFGAGAARVDVRRIGATDTTLGLDVAGAALAANPALDLAAEPAELLRDGRVDERLLTTLATLAADHRVAVAAFPVPDAERAAGVAARTVDIVAVDDRPVAGDDPAIDEVVAFLDRQRTPYRPSSADLVAGDDRQLRLRITFPVL